MRAAIYLRVSSKEQVDQFGLENQLESIKSLIASRQDLELAGEKHVYIDWDVSGTLDRDDRPWMSRLFMYAGENEFDVVIVYKIDRLARKLRVLLDVVEAFNDNNLNFISTQESIDTSNPFWRAMLWILWVIAELDRDTSVERMSESKKIAVSKWSVMHDVYGYERKVIWWLRRPYIKENEAEIISTIFDLFLNHHFSIADIYNYLRENKVPIPAISKNNDANSKEISDPYLRQDKTVREILKNEFYTWKYYYWKTETIEEIDNKKDGKKRKKKVTRKVSKEKRNLCTMKHESIIEQSRFDDAQKLLDNKTSQRKKTSDFLLSWLLTCDHCKDKRVRWRMHFHGNSSHQIQCYHCRWKNKDKATNAKKWTYICPVIPIKKEQIEMLVLDEVKRIFNKPEVIKEYITESNYNHERLQALREERRVKKQNLDRLQSWITNIKEMIEYGNTDVQSWMLKIKEKEEAIILVKKYLHDIDIDVNELEELWKYKYGLDKIQKLLGERLENILNNKLECKRFLQSIIEEIVVYSSIREESDPKTWRRNKKQYIPRRIKIIFRLPQEFLDWFFFEPDDGSDWSWDNLSPQPTSNSTKKDKASQKKKQKKSQVESSVLWFPPGYVLQRPIEVN